MVRSLRLLGLMVFGVSMSAPGLARAQDSFSLIYAVVNLTATPTKVSVAVPSEIRRSIYEMAPQSTKWDARVLPRGLDRYWIQANVRTTSPTGEPWTASCFSLVPPEKNQWQGVTFHIKVGYGQTPANGVICTIVQF